MIPTRDHDQIQQWAERHEALPAQVRQLKFDGEPAVLTFVFGDPDVAKPDIYALTWEMFFAQFDLLQLSIAWDELSTQFSIVKAEKRSAAHL